MDQTPTPPQEQVPQTAATYYNNDRKRSFLFSRITVMSSMFILVVALAINISLLSSQEKTSTQSRASVPQADKSTLPSLAAGCEYQKVKDGFTVVCPTPTQIASVPIDIALPKLPPECSLQTSTTGNKIQCTTPHAPIPTVPVTLPISCTATNQTNIVQCTQGNKAPVMVSMPSLPEGCVYTLVANKYYVDCQSL